MRVQLVGIVRVFVILIALASLAPVSVAAQPSSSAATSVPRTPDGRPDLQGVWDFGSVTSLQRPASLAGKEFLTEEDVSALEAQAAKGRIDRAPPPCATAGQHRRLQPAGAKHGWPPARKRDAGTLVLRIATWTSGASSGSIPDRRYCLARTITLSGCSRLQDTS